MEYYAKALIQRRFSSAARLGQEVDQVNVRIPRSLIGRGLADVTLTVDGVAANIVQVNIK